MEALGITLQQLLTQLVSFLILFFLLYKLAYGPIMGMLDSRALKIKESLEAAETARLDAASSAERVEAEIASARVDGQKIVAEARDAASKLREQEQVRAREEVEVMLGRARTEIGREKDAAVDPDRAADLAHHAALSGVRCDLQRTRALSSRSTAFLL